MMPKIGDDYVLPVGEGDQKRLAVLQSVYGPHCQTALLKLQIPLSGRCADIGCGSGTMSQTIAAIVGGQGHVDAVDISAEQINVARQSPHAVGCAAITYHEGSVYELGLKPASYDLVFCRFLLCHLVQREKALANMISLLKPGGRLVIMDIEIHTLFTIPPTGLYEEYIAYCRKTQDIIGTDYEIGLRLPAMFAALGLKNLSVELAQPIYNDGPRKRLWQNTFKNAWPSMVKNCLATLAELEDLYARMEEFAKNPETWVGHVRTTLVSGQK